MTRDRLLTAAGVLLGLAAFAVIMFPEQSARRSPPTSVETGAGGYSAIVAWLRDAGIPVASHRQRLTQLTTGDYRRGSLLITTLPHRKRLVNDEVRALQQWVREGNTLLVLAAFMDVPDWAAAAGQGAFERVVALCQDFETLTGVVVERITQADRSSVDCRHASEREQPEDLASTTVELRAIAAHPLAAGVGTLAGLSDRRVRQWHVTAADAAPRLRLAVTAEQGEKGSVTAFWHQPSGAGHIFSATIGSLLTNRALGVADNATLFTNLIRHHLAPDGIVIFDDLHQGLSALYDPRAFFRDPRLHASVAFVLAWWFIYMVGTWDRLVPVRATRATPDQREFVCAVGGFLARKLDPVAAGRLMFESWFAAWPGGSADFDVPPWERVDEDVRLSPALKAALKADYARLRAGWRVDLRRLHNRIRAASL